MRKLLTVAAAVSLITLACVFQQRQGNRHSSGADGLHFDRCACNACGMQGVGGKGEELRLGLGVAAEGGSVFAAGRKGDVLAFNLENGSTIWRKDTKTLLAGGTGAGDGLVVVGSSEGVRDRAER